MEKVTDSDDDGNSKTRCPTKIISFSINDITSHGYSMQLITKMLKLMKNLLGLKQPEATRAIVATAKPTPDVLNFVNFLSTIDQVILSNLQLQLNDIKFLRWQNG